MSYALSKISKTLNFLVKPKSKNKDLARKEFILKVLLVGILSLTLILVFICSIVKIYKATKGELYDGIPPEIMFFVFLIFFFI